MSSTGSSYGYAKARTSTIDLLSVSSSEPDTSDDKTGGKDGLTPPLKSTGLETEEEEEEEEEERGGRRQRFFCGNGEQYAAVYGKSCNNKSDNGKRKRSPKKKEKKNKNKKKRITLPDENKNPMEEKRQNETSARHKKWYEQYHLAVAQYKETRFDDLTSGGRVYNWLQHAKSQVSIYDNFLRNGGSSHQHDQNQAQYSSSWTADRIEMVRDLVTAFNNHHGARAGGTATPGGVGTVGHHCRPAASRPTLSHVRHSDRGVSNSFDFSMKLNSERKCRIPENQELYCQVITAANRRFTIAEQQNNWGHYQTGKYWTYCAKKIHDETKTIDCTAAAQANGKLKIAVDHFFVHGQFPENV